MDDWQLASMVKEDEDNRTTRLYQFLTFDPHWLDQRYSTAYIIVPTIGQFVSVNGEKQSEKLNKYSPSYKDQFVG